MHNEEKVIIMSLERAGSLFLLCVSCSNLAIPRRSANKFRIVSKFYKIRTQKNSFDHVKCSFLSVTVDISRFMLYGQGLTGTGSERFTDITPLCMETKDPVPEKMKNLNFF